MSKFSGLKKSDKINFIEQSSAYSESRPANKGVKVTFTMTAEYIHLLNDLSKKDRLAKSQIIRISLLKFAQLTKKEREECYEAVISNDSAIANT
jgi:hypothetical protein